MTERTQDEGKEWSAVIARSLAFLCLVNGDLRDKGLATQGRFLEALGLSRKDAATLLGTSSDSLAVLLSRSTKKKGLKGGRNKKSQ